MPGRVWQAGTISVVGELVHLRVSVLRRLTSLCLGFCGKVSLFSFLFFFIFITIIIIVCMWVCALEHVSALALEGTLRRQKRALDLLMLDSQVVVSYTVWVLGTKLSSSGSVVHSSTKPSFQTPPSVLQAGISSCLSFPNAGITGMNHYARL